MATNRDPHLCEHDGIQVLTPEALMQCAACSSVWIPLPELAEPIQPAPPQSLDNTLDSPTFGQALDGAQQVRAEIAHCLALQKLDRDYQTRPESPLHHDNRCPLNIHAKEDHL